MARNVIVGVALAAAVGAGAAWGAATALWQRPTATVLAVAPNPNAERATAPVDGGVASSFVTQTNSGGDPQLSATAESVMVSSPPAAARRVNDRLYRDVTVPAGTALRLSLHTPVASDTSRAEDRVNASLRQAVIVNGTTVIPAGSGVNGLVTSVHRAGKVKGRASLALRFTGLRARGEHYAIGTRTWSQQARATKGKDAAKIAAPAGIGAVIGGVVGGKKGAATGAAIGGGAGTAVVLTTRGEEVRLTSGTPLVVRLASPLTVRVPR